MIALRAIEDPELNKATNLSKWFEFYSTEMRELINVFDQLLDQLTENSSDVENNKLKKAFTKYDS